MSYLIKHNEEEQQFELTINEMTAVVEYELRDGRIIFTHTGVPKELEGKGIGSALVKYALDYALENHLQIIPICPFVKLWIERHPEYKQNKS